MIENAGGIVRLPAVQIIALPAVRYCLQGIQQGSLSLVWSVAWLCWGGLALLQSYGERFSADSRASAKLIRG